jgi:hypothetical protein
MDDLAQKVLDLDAALKAAHGVVHALDVQMLTAQHDAMAGDLAIAVRKLFDFEVQEPVGWQSRFSGADRASTWSACSREHFDDVIEHPENWPALAGEVYKVRALYARPVPASDEDARREAAVQVLRHIRFHVQRRGMSREWLTLADDVLGTFGPARPDAVVRREDHEAVLVRLGEARRECEDLRAIPAGKRQAVRMTDAEIARAVHATTGDPDDRIDFSAWARHPDGAEFLRISRAVEAAVLAANGLGDGDA